MGRAAVAHHRTRCASLCAQVRPELVPLYLSKDLADKVLFVGRAVRVLKEPKGALSGHTLLPLQVGRKWCATCPGAGRHASCG